MERWEKLQKHDQEIRTELKQLGCMDSKGQIRAWKPEVWPKLNALGHTSLDPDKCACTKHSHA